MSESSHSGYWITRDMEAGQMENGTKKTMNQKELVQRLQDLGCLDVTLRRIAGWRANDLLPVFDVNGRGKGRGPGRESNVWLDGESVVNQAFQIYQLLKTHKAFVDLYLPLWILGYPLPFSRIRQALTKPLETTINDVTCEVNDTTSVEDYIDDVAYEFSQGMVRANWGVLDMPQETLAAILNILLNSAYDMKDQPFEDGSEFLRDWERNFQLKCFDLLDDAHLVSEAKQIPNESGIFKHAAFVHEYLSVSHLRQVVLECTDDDLLVVADDLRICREIVTEIRRLLPAVLPYVPEEMQPPKDEVLATILSVGKLLSWIDLALRRSGYGDFISFILNSILEGIKSQSIEELEDTMTEHGTDIAEMLTFMKEFTNWVCENSALSLNQPS